MSRTRIVASALVMWIALPLSLSPAAAERADRAAPRFKAVAFDYFVIFNANSVTPAVEKAFPGKGAEFTRAWRAKQFEYGFLRSITGRHADFFAVTEDALVYTAAAMKLELSADTRKRLLDAYLSDGLWLRNARQANTMAARLGDGLKAIPGTELLSSPQANILFCRLPQQAIEGLLAEGYTFYHDRWAPGIVRLVTSFSHTPEDIDQLLDAVRRHTR